MPQDIDKAVKGIGTLINLQTKYPVGFNIVVSIIMFLAGNFWGRMDSKDEVERITHQNTTLLKNQSDILTASLEKNGIIAVKTEQNVILKADNDTLKQLNDTLSSTINQVGQTLLEAKNPALKILNK